MSGWQVLQVHESHCVHCLHCTICTLGSLFFSRLNKLGISSNIDAEILLILILILVPTCTGDCKIEKVLFP